MTARRDPIAELLEKLSKYPEVEYHETVQEGFRTLRIEPLDEEGFPVTLEDDLDEWTVQYGYGSAHFRFDVAEDALELIAMTLSEDARLVEVWYGDFPQKGSIQVWTGDRWRTTYASGILIWPFWRRKRVVVRRNRLIKSESNPPN